MALSLNTAMIDLRNTRPPIPNNLNDINSNQRPESNDLPNHPIDYLTQSDKSNNNKNKLKNENNIQTNLLENEESLRRLHAMIVHFCQLDNGLLSNDINLMKYSKDSGQTITNTVVQELCIIQPNIITLDLSNCIEVSDIGLWALAKHCQQLQNLNLSGCNLITHIGLRSLSLCCSSVTILTFNDCYILDDMALTVIAAGSWRLQELYLRNCRGISDTGISRIAKAGSTLRILDLYGCSGVGEFGDTALIEIGAIAMGLTYLDLSKVKRIEDAGLRAIAVGCQKLEYFALNGCDRLNGESIRYLCKYTKQLKILKLINYKQLYDKNLNYFQLSCFKNQLIELNISYCYNITDNGVAAVAKSFINLQNISIKYNKRITDTSIDILSKLCIHLRSLDLSNCNNLTNQCIDSITNNITSLTTLKINNISNITINKLINNKIYLEFADISNQWYGYQPKKHVEKLINEREYINYQIKNCIKIQSIIRRKLAYKVYAHKLRFYYITKVIPKIQALVRRYLQRIKWLKVKQFIYCINCIIKIQQFYRKYSTIQKKLVIKRKNQILLLDHQNAIIIQKTYRGLIGKRKCRMKRNQLVNQRLNDTKNQALYEIMAIRIQKNFRMYYNKRYVMLLLTNYRNKLRYEQLKVISSIIIQKYIRSRLSRNEMNRRRNELELFKYKWLCCRLIQKVFRGLLGRKKAILQRLLLIKELQRKAVINIQRVFRGYRGRLLTAIAKALRILRIQRNNAAITIQRIQRGIIDRKLTNELRLKYNQMKLENDSAIMIQRIYRGHKGREIKIIELELKKLDYDATPLVNTLVELENKANNLRKVVNQMTIDNKNNYDILESIENELDFVMKSTNKYTDSSRLNNTLQRYHTKFLKERLKEYYEHEKDLYKFKTNELDRKISELRTIESQIRSGKREIVPLTTGKVMNVKHERALQLRTQVRDRMNAAIKIQSVWRGSLVRIGYKDTARDYWIECYDEDQSEYPFYFNTWTNETNWNMPLAYRYFSNPNLGIKPKKAVEFQSIATEDSLESL